ncbi:MAG: hypothetical protein ABI947_14505 [Chloroflexota bacterium]
MTSLTAPSALFIATADGHVARASGVSPSTATYQDISPTSLQRTGLGTTLKLVADPHLYKRLILFGAQGGLMTNDATAASVVWQSIYLTGPRLRDQFAIDLTIATLTCGTYHTDPTKSYTFQISGTVAYGNGVCGDAMYQTPDCTWSTHTPVTTCPIDDGTHCSSTDMNNSGPFFSADDPSYNAAHVYKMTRMGTGFAFGAKVLDSGNSDNTGSWVAAVYEQIPVNETAVFPVADIQGSANRKGYFGWLSKVTISGTDYIHYNYTPDLFNTVNSTQIAKYSTSMTYAIVMSPFTLNGGAAGKVWVTAGDPASGDAAIYESSDWGAHFVALGTPALNAGGGAIDLPFSLPSGVFGATAQNLVTLQKVT